MLTVGASITVGEVPPEGPVPVPGSLLNFV